MILPEKPIDYCRFYFNSSAFSPLQQQQITHQALRKLRGSLSAEIKSLSQGSQILQMNDKDLNSCKTQSGFTSNPQTDNIKLFQKNSNQQFFQDLQLKSLFSTQNKKQKKLKQKNKSCQSPCTRLRNKKPFKYDFDLQSEEEKQSKRCQTKNIVKNFIRSVLCFLRKNQLFSIRLLDSLKIDHSQFTDYVQKIQGKINTIFQLRQLWTEDKYNKAFRIISSYFLRKYYPKHIFNSRIFNHKIHLKYRVKLNKSLEIPQDFTSLKEF